MRTTDVLFTIDLDQEFSVSLMIDAEFSGNPADGWHCEKAMANAHGAWFCAAGPLVMVPCREDMTNWLRQHIEALAARKTEVWVRVRRANGEFEELTLNQLLLRQWEYDRDAMAEEFLRLRPEHQYEAPVFGAATALV